MEPQMSDHSPTPFFIPLSKFKAYGLPCDSKVYADAKVGLIDLIRFNGKTGVTPQEAARYIAANSRRYGEGTPIRDTSKATAARQEKRRASV
jgi:hypothetical protein